MPQPETLKTEKYQNAEQQRVHVVECSKQSVTAGDSRLIDINLISVWKTKCNNFFTAKTRSYRELVSERRRISKAGSLLHIYISLTRVWATDSRSELLASWTR